MSFIGKWMLAGVIVAGGLCAIVWRLGAPTRPATISSILSPDHAIPSTQPDARTNAGAAASTVTAPRSSKPRNDALELSLLEDLRSGDPAVSTHAVVALQQLVASQPRQIVADLSRWILPLLEAELYPEILELTQEAILLRPHETSAVSDFQLARVQALLALENHEQALIEARSAFNVSQQKTVDRAVALLIQAVQAAKADATLVERLKNELAGHSSDSSSVLSAIQAGKGHFAAKASQPSGDSFEALLGKGNLLLLSDQPAAARDAFLAAGKTPECKGKKLFIILEGVIASQRSQRGSVAAGNEIIQAMKFGAVESPSLSVIAPLNINIDELQTAGRRIPVASVPSGAVAQAGASDLPASPSLKGRMQRAIQVLNAASPSDPALLAWLEGQNQGHAVSDPAGKELAGILAQTNLHPIALFELGSAYLLATEDRPAAAEFYKAAAARSTVELERAPTPADRTAILRAMVDHMEHYKATLWPLIESPTRDARSDDALNTLYSIYTDLPRWSPPDDKALASVVRRVNVGRAECLYLQDKLTEAIELLESLDRTKFNPGEQTAFDWAYALVLQRVGRDADAVKYLEACSNAPGFKYARSAHQRLVYALAKENHLQEAENYCHAFGQRFTSDSDTLNYGRMLHDISHFEDAVSILTHAVSSIIDPSDVAEARVLLVLCLTRLNRLEDAQAEWKKLTQSGQQPSLMAYCQAELSRAIRTSKATAKQP